MADSAFPTVADVQALLIGGGFLPDPLTAAQKLLPWKTWETAARREFERRTGFAPFIAAATPVTRTYSPPDDGVRLLDLGTGFVSVSAVVVDGITLTSAEYALLPESAPVDGEPYTMLRFACRQYARPGGISIAGRAGYTAIEDGAVSQAGELSDVWQAVQGKAAAEALKVLMSMPGEGRIERVKQGDVDITYATGVTERQLFLNGCEAAFEAAVRFYKLAGLT